MLESFRKSVRCAFSSGTGPSGSLRLLGRGMRIALSQVVSAKPKKGIILIHEGRVGSTALGTLLDQQKGLYWDGEVYTKLKERGRSYYDNIFESSEARRSYLEKRSCRSLGIPYGLEIKVGQLFMGTQTLEDELSMVRGLFVDSSFVLLIRENAMRRLISVLQGIERGDWHSGRPSDSMVTINVSNVWGVGLAEWLDRFIEERTLVAEALEKMGCSPLNLTFEADVVRDPGIGTKRICEFGGIDYRAGKSLVRESTYRPLAELIRNIDEVRQALAGTEHDWMIDE